jgi:adenine-specific DNA-methyltransferase
MSQTTTPEQQLAALRARADRRRLGQFFTPEPLARYLAKQALLDDPQTVLDPAVGGGRLLRALPDSVARYGIDIDPAAIDVARPSLPPDVELATGDFLATEAWPLSQERFDAIVANPPYIRHHRLTQAQKARRAELNQRLGISISAFADYYIYFFCEAIHRLNPGGRLAFVTPALFLDAGYGEALKALMLREGTIEQITVFDHNRGVFDEERTAAAVTVFQRKPSKRFVTFREAEFNGRVDQLSARRIDPRRIVPADAWRQHLPSRDHTREATTGVRLGDILHLRRGLATGSNAYFCLTDETRRAARIPERHLQPVLDSARDLPDREFTLEDWQRRRDAGHRVWLLWCHTPKESIRSSRVRAYLDAGEEAGVNLRPTCQSVMSRPWHAVEDVDPPDYLFTYMSKHPLRFVENTASVRALTALLGGSLQPGVDPAYARSVLLSDEASVAITRAAQDLGAGLRKIEPRRLADVVIPAAPT